MTGNRADLRSTLRYARVARCTPNCDIFRQCTPQNQIGTAFGTARFSWLSLSADDASLFHRVGPVHQGGHRKASVWRRASDHKADQSQKQSSAALCRCLGPQYCDRSFGRHVVWKVARRRDLRS
jgi:hypothetical protein